MRPHSLPLPLLVFPVLRMQRVVPEALALDLPADVLDNYLYNNAAEFFFGEKGN